MSKLSDQVSYLKGLANGMKLNPDKDSHKLILEIVSVLEEMSEEIGRLNEHTEDLSEYVEAIDDDLSTLEELCYEDEDRDNDDEEITYECPHCGYEVTFSAGDVDFEADSRCPACGKELFPETLEDEESSKEEPFIENPEDE